MEKDIYDIDRLERYSVYIEDYKEFLSTGFLDKGSKLRAICENSSCDYYAYNIHEVAARILLSCVTK